VGICDISLNSTMNDCNINVNLSIHHSRYPVCIQTVICHLHGRLNEIILREHNKLRLTIKIKVNNIFPLPAWFASHFQVSKYIQMPSHTLS
jgi:hypothetical protein